MILGVVSPSLFSEEFKYFAEQFCEEDVVIELKLEDLTEFSQVSIVDLIDLSDYLDILEIEIIRLPRFNDVIEYGFQEAIEKAVLIADELNAKFLVIPCIASDIRKFKGIPIEIYSELIEYKKILCFEPQLTSTAALEGIIELMESLEKEYSPSPFALSYDIGTSFSRPILNDIYDLMSFLRIIHICDLTEYGEKISPFKPNAKMNPYELLDFLLESRYTDYLLLHYDDKFTDMYINDVSKVRQYVASYLERF